MKDFDATKLVELFYDFLVNSYYVELLNNINNGKHFLEIDFKKLSYFNPDLAEYVLEKPEESFEAINQAVSSMDVDKKRKFFPRFFNLPSSQHFKIRELRKEHIDKLICVEGIIRQKSDVKPKTKSAKFECQNCGKVVNILQMNNKFKEPSRCSCGRKSSFILISEEMEDVQWMSIEESIDENIGDRIRKIKILLVEDLVSPFSEKKTLPGNRILICGILKKMPVEINNVKQTQYDLFIEANYVEPIEEMFDDLKITKEDEEMIKTIAKKEPFYKMVEAILPNVYGYTIIKKALVLQCFGGVRKERKEDFDLRGDIHILLIGDPGVAKSGILKRMCEIYPKSRYVVAASSTGVGLTGAVVRDELIKGYTLEAGALSLANKGLCAIDELDKTTDEDRNKLHEAMEQQTITISKANIQERLPAETTVLAAANPKYGRFDVYEKEILQTDLPPSLLNRFDLIFILKDIPNEEEDRHKAEFILRKHIEAVKGKDESQNPFNNLSFFKKYIAYARLNCKPILTEEAKNYIVEYFVKMRRNTSGDERFKTIPISARQLEAIIRLSEAYVKTKLGRAILKEDVEFAISIFEECMKNVAFDESTGKIDVDMISTGTPSSAKNKFALVLNAVDRLKNENGLASIQDVCNDLISKGIGEYEAEWLIQRLISISELSEVRKGYVRRDYI